VKTQTYAAIINFRKYYLVDSHKLEIEKLLKYYQELHSDPLHKFGNETAKYKY